MNDIEVLEERAITLKRHIKYYEESDCLTDVYQQLVEECNAIENLLKRNKDLEQIEAEHQRINGELRERVKELENSNENYKKYAVMMSTEGLIINGVIFSFNDYISKSKIKEKIEEKQKRIDKMHPASDCVLIDDLENQIEVLEELLKGE